MSFITRMGRAEPHTRTAGSWGILAKLSSRHRYGEGNVLLIATDAVQRLGVDEIEPALRGVRQQALNAGRAAGPGNGAVRVHLDRLMTLCPMSWEEAKGYVTWLKQMTGKDYRLLSEAEWEYAARAGNPGRWSFGDDETQFGDYAWFRGNSDGKTQPVAKKKPNAFGLYDMHGNVWQWVEDPYHGNYKGAPSDGSVWSQGVDASRRVLRGGSWSYGPVHLRSALRLGFTTVDRLDYVGFRVGRALTP
jgi:formylglycine-generating enzyme required for sulfatase activity